MRSVGARKGVELAREIAERRFERQGASGMRAHEPRKRRPRELGVARFVGGDRREVSTKVVVVGAEARVVRGERCDRLVNASAEERVAGDGGRIDFER